MLVEVTAGGALAKHLPPENSGSRAQITLPDGSTALVLLTRLGIDPDRRLLLILNGDMLSRPEWPHRMLTEGDSLSLMPPIKAG